MNRILITGILTLFPGLLFANEFTYSAEVVSSEEVTVTRTTTRTMNAMPDWCHSNRPTSFDQILKWDVGCEQPQTVEETAYRVTYAIDGKHFSTVHAEPPGRYIPIRIRLDTQDSTLLAQRSHTGIQ